MASDSPTQMAPRGTPLGRAVDVLAMAISVGITAGWVHTLELSVARYLQHQLVWFSRDFVWMSPVAYTLLLLPAALLLSIGAVLIPGVRIRSVSLFLLAWVAIFGVLLPYSQLARIAALVLAAGVAVQLARITHAAPERWFRRFRRFALGGAAVVTLLGIGLPKWRANVSTRAVAAVPVPTSPSPPANVLLIILDTVRAASMSLYGAADSTTPRLQAWARDATVFDDAYAAAPWTLPSHASLFTGRYPGELTADWKTSLDRSDSTLAELFRGRGYTTAAFMANMHYTAWDSGLDRGFATYEDYRLSWWQLVRSSAWTQTRLFDQLRAAKSLGAAVSAFVHPDLSIDIKHTFDRKRAGEVTRQFLDWQAGVAPRPFFAVLNYFDAHQPYYAPPRFHYFPKDESGTSRYSAAIAYLDASIDSILVELQRRNALDNTLVIVTSDHGELFDEHGLTGHAHNLYRNVLHVPLLLRFPPAVPSAQRVTRTVSLRDLPATIIDLAALSHATVPGHSLRAAWTDSTPQLSPVLAEVSQAPNVNTTYPTAKGPMKALLDDSVHYIRNGDAVEELYRYRVDSPETANLAASSATAAAPWRARVDSILASRQHPRQK